MDKTFVVAVLLISAQGMVASVARTQARSLASTTIVELAVSEASVEREDALVVVEASEWSS